MTELFLPGFKGHIIENYVFNQFNRLGKNIQQFYYSNKNNKEVDFILETSSGLKVVEVKSKK